MKKLLLSATVLGAAVSGGAQAALSLEAFGGFVNDPMFMQPMGFEGFPPLGGSTATFYGCGDDGQISGNPLCTSISWGTPTGTGGPFAGQSGASINVPPGDAGTADDPGPERDEPLDNEIIIDPNELGVPGTLGTLTHFNETINDSGVFDDGWFAAVQVEYDFTVTDTDTMQSVNFAELFTVVFNETDNAVDDIGECDPQVSDTPCDDTFRFFGTDSIDFTLSGVDYVLEITGFCAGETLATCDPAGLFISEEGGNSIGYVLETKDVPVPGVLALVGAGLIGLGFARRRQAKA